MAIQMSRDEMLEDLVLTWKGIQRLDPESSININEATEMWSKLDDTRLAHTYNGARAVLWRLISEREI